MIKNESEYRDMVERLKKDNEQIAHQLEALRQEGLTEEQLERAMQPLHSFRDQLQEEIEYYERIKRMDFDAIRNFNGVGRLFIAIRIARGMTQRQLAERLGVPETQVSRDERNEYHNITIERAEKVLRALGAVLRVEVEELREQEFDRADGIATI